MGEVVGKLLYFNYYVRYTVRRGNATLWAMSYHLSILILYTHRCCPGHCRPGTSHCLGEVPTDIM